MVRGQARKSLWIETAAILATAATPVMVRLVRACGSKHLLLYPGKGNILVRLVRACGSKPDQKSYRHK